MSVKSQSRRRLEAGHAGPRCGGWTDGARGGGRGGLGSRVPAAAEAGEPSIALILANTEGFSGCLMSSAQPSRRSHLRLLPAPLPLPCITP